MKGKEALAAFNLAASLVKQGKPEEALKVPMLESDRKVIEQRIAASAKTANTKETK